MFYIQKGRVDYMADDKKYYLSEVGLVRLVANSINSFAKKVHSHTTSDITDYAVDDVLSSTSENPIQNKAVNVKFEAVQSSLDTKSQGQFITLEEGD